MATKSKKPSPRNHLGRTESEQAAIDRLTQTVEAITKGEITANPVGYDFTAYNVGTDAPFTGRNKGMAIISSIGSGDARYVSFQEAKKRGWNVKGAKGVPFIRPVTAKYEDAEGEEQERTRWKSYYLFNLADIEHDLGNMPLDDTCLEAEQASKVLEACVTEIGAKFERQADVAHMSPSAGVVSLPAISCFKSWELYCSTLIHEITHFIGRESKTVREYETYRGFEELVAEIGAVLVLTQIGITFPSKNCAYIAGWLEHAKTTHKDAMYEAIVEASKRTDSIVDAYRKLSKAHLKAA